MIDHLVAHNSFREVSRSEATQAGRTPLRTMWVYRIKRTVDHQVERFKARLCVCGYRQIFGLDYVETFAAVAQIKTFRLLMALSVIFGFTVLHIDIADAFLSADLKETIYMEHPPGYPGTPGTVLLLNKTLFGLKQSPRVFAQKLKAVLAAIGFVLMVVPCTILCLCAGSYGSLTMV